MAKTQTRVDMKKFALVGAAARLAELQGEIQRIYQSFPSLRRGPKPAPSSDPPVVRRRRGRKKMSAAARKAVSLRMKKYWAAKKKA